MTTLLEIAAAIAWPAWLLIAIQKLLERKENHGGLDL